MKKKIKIGFTNEPIGFGGPTTFQINITKYLQNKNIEVVNNIYDKDLDCIILLSSTRKIFSLIKCKINRIKIIQRLDGINYKSLKQVSNIRLFLYLKIVNLLMHFIRKYLADFVVYQSKFTFDWWHKKYGKVNKPYKIIHNGTNNHAISKQSNSKYFDIICIEGNYNENEHLELIKNVYTNLDKEIFKKIHIVGNTTSKFKKKLAKYNDIYFHGHVSREQIINLRKSNCIQMSVDFNAACSNSVIEALMQGIPIIGLNTGSLKELVGDKAGIITAYDGDTFTLSSPINYKKISQSAKVISENYDTYSHNAKVRANDKFNINDFGSKYLDVISKVLV